MAQAAFAGDTATGLLSQCLATASPVLYFTVPLQTFTTHVRLLSSLKKFVAKSLRRRLVTSRSNREDF
jgi:hypothetical protein